MWVIKRLYQFTFLFPWPFVSGSILLIISMILSNTGPFFVKWLTEAVQVNDLDRAFQLLIGFAIVLFSLNILENLGFYITDKNMVKTSTAIAHKVLTHIHNLDFSYHTNKSSGKLISLMKRGDDAFYSYYDTFNRQFLAIFLSFVVMFIGLAQLKVHYIIFVFGLIIISIIISYFLVQINIKRRNLFNDADDNVSSARVDNLVNFDTVKYFANEEFEQTRFRQLLDIWNKKLQDYFFTFRYFDVILGNLINVALLGMMAIALHDVRSGAITLADFLLVTTFSMTLFPKMMSFLFSLRDLAKRYSDMHAYFRLLEEPIIVEEPKEPQTITDPKGRVAFDTVSFGYDQSNPILQDFNLEIHAGESLALVGYSGAGKTTIAKLLMRMYDPQQGIITIDGIDIKTIKKVELRSLVGIVPQDPLLFNNTIYYNIAYANSKASKEEVITAAKAARVDDFVQKLPKGYETVVGERGIKLSGGQRQRLAIARVLLEQPKIIIFDEATSALDSASEQIIQEAFWRLVRDPVNPRTAIIIAHRLSTIMKADTIVVMDKGEVVEKGKHEELLANKKGIYRQLWSLQKNGFIADGESEES